MQHQAHLDQYRHRTVLEAPSQLTFSPPITPFQPSPKPLNETVLTLAHPASLPAPDPPPITDSPLVKYSAKLLTGLSCAGVAEDDVDERGTTNS